MESQGPQSFHGNGMLLLPRAVCILIPAILLLSILFMGANFAAIFVSAAIVTIPFMILLAAASSLLDKFSFYDQEEHIALSLNRRIPYQRVKAVVMRETGSFLHVSVKQGRGFGTSLAWALDAKERERLVEAIEQRFPKDVLRRKKPPDVKVTAGILSVVLVLVALYHYALYRECRQLAVVPQKIDVTVPRDYLRAAQKYGADAFIFALPRGYRLRGNLLSQFYFIEGKTKTRITIAFGQHREAPARFERLLRKGLGLRDYLSVLRTSYGSRFGVIPLTVKSLQLCEIRDVRVFLIEHDGFEGFITQGTRGGDATAQIVLFGADRNDEIDVTISGPAALNDKTVRGIAGSVGLVKKKDDRGGRVS